MTRGLATPVAVMNLVGRTTADRLKKLGIQTIEDLIFYYPFRYEDLSQVVLIADLTPFSTVTIRGKVEMVTSRRSWKARRTVTEGLITDKSGSIKAIWFNQPYLTKVLVPGDEVYLSGKVATDRYTVQLVNPVYEKIKRHGEPIHTARIIPIYSLTDGLTQKQIRWLIKSALESVDQVVDWLPVSIRQRLDVPDLREALEQIHFPSTDPQLETAVHRLKFDELFLFLLQSQLIKQDLAGLAARPIPFQEAETKAFVASLPFILTDDQKKSSWQIIKDLQKSRPMNRLLEGEVGAGKTVVAAMAIYNAALSGGQSILMAPTELLASQHFTNFKKLFAAAQVVEDGVARPIRIALLTRVHQVVNDETRTKATISRQMAAGKIDFLIGTHALLQESIAYKKAVLVIIDEQHRFGVEQRKILYDKSSEDGLVPHFLSMTATPIPRSLALTLYGDLDVSVIRQLPSERKKIITEIIQPPDRARAYQFIKQQVAEGRQVYVICPLIDPSDNLGVKSVAEESTKLQEQIFPDLRIAVLHGKLKPADKERVMAEFVNHQIDILVATSVVEVGINVPNASVILIEGAERFGLAQLYQFRGRVGRGAHQSYCYVALEKNNPKSAARLEALVTARDSFELAEIDLAQRGPGDVLGVHQSGVPEFRLASLFDHRLIVTALEEAKTLLAADPGLNTHAALRQKIALLNRDVHRE